LNDALTQNNTAAGSSPDHRSRLFRVSEKPVIRGDAREEVGVKNFPALPELPDTYGVDLLYVIARDPNSLFLYWDLDWDRVFSEAALGPREIHLRVLREDGTEETTVALDPEAGYFFTDVAAPDARYVCELGCFDGAEWKSLVRSPATATPAAAASRNRAADFATLPFHLAFQRLLEIFRSTGVQRKTLAVAISEMQSRARALQQTMTPAEWKNLVELAISSVTAESDFAFARVQAAELASLLPAAEPEQNDRATSPEMTERWERFGERFTGSSSGGASSRPNELA
jgi:hypothetical protein